MNNISASEAKQNFGMALARAATEPVGIERHGKLVAALVPPQWLEGAHLLDARRRARQDQKQIEQNRLMAHQRIAIRLLSDPEDKRRLLASARQEVKRWSEQKLCSLDYIERWTEWLALPAAGLVDRMCSDANGWGVAMRQNSPFGTSHR
jgi:antitoxin (DNA-binding transcriptional repressor) of toxin-antitoxin stability system